MKATFVDDKFYLSNFWPGENYHVRVKFEISDEMSSSFPFAMFS